ncbi:hypothetical protein DACRYDRAFT_66798 [Dacryopinax primogenitus]|uniref:NAD(P)-binding protein n=1 Tax=Dacryopinax primogenitus (strain DJM 731) TaxID=1858805 RepID=M5FZA3_DACPD|nr:uncharacterized protein DACRYDRAFT_66798 [Dacryopinax primogenitus]EJU01844.1 hypothetical protein DACRYDRAFT_66798 [Dacryopinax primogenitus]
MHGRTVLITGGLTPLGLTILDSLAAQGAHLILLEPTLSSSAQLLIPVLQEAHKNREIHVAECDLSSGGSVREFVARFGRTLTLGEEGRVDALVLVRGYGWASALSKGGGKPEGACREELGQFHLSTLLLPMLLRAQGRDIRIVNVVNPFYAAAFPGFPGVLFPPSGEGEGKGKAREGKGKGEDRKISSFQKEGIRSLRSIIWSVHLQRVLDALVPQPTEASPSEEEKTSEGTDGETPLLGKGSRRRSNILSVAVCPGFSRTDIAAPYLGALGPGTTFLGQLRYILLWPMMFFLLKPPSAAAESVLYALYAPASHSFLPPASSTTSSSPPSTGTSNSPSQPVPAPVQRVQGGALYRECRVVLPPQDVRDWGGEAVGRGVWEMLERGLKSLEQEQEMEKKSGKGLETVREEPEPEPEKSS